MMNGISFTTSYRLQQLSVSSTATPHHAPDTMKAHHSHWLPRTKYSRCMEIAYNAAPSHRPAKMPHTIGESCRTCTSSFV
ncbi:unnamed protein product [Amoebophrya sp. A120]|nr:unnamed protein product [Amoebophrya sp. A120]|eukprot:GSA120T00016999001.1